MRFLETLRSRDLYLSCACGLPNDKAWRRFERDYRAYICEIANQVTRNCSAADDLACGVLADLFFPDRSGHSRIASFDGQCSLATWLRVVIANKATNERGQRWNTVECFDSVPDVIDEASDQQPDLRVRAGRYEPIIAGAFRDASGSLSQSDRVLLLLRYDQGIQGSDIARMNGVHPSTITRRLRQLHKQLRNEIVSILAHKHRLNHDAIEECISDISPAIGLLRHLLGSSSTAPTQVFKAASPIIDARMINACE